MSQYKAYPKYKDSGIEWLGEVPDHWMIGSLKNVARIRNGQDHKDVECLNGEYPVIGSGGRFSLAKKYLYDGESVLLGRKGTINKPLYINGRFWTVDTMFYTEIASEVYPKFVYYRCLIIPFDYYSTNTALPSMTQADLRNHPLAFPDMAEQVKIAIHLDQETARIDALVDKQSRLIELLREKRQSIITEAVTKGLNPNVPMKDSGVEWLGEVPEHWDVKPLKHIANQITDKAKTSTFQVGLENVEGWTGLFIKTDSEFTGSGILFSQGDILFGKLRPYLAKAWLADTEGEAVGDFFVIRPISMASDFIHSYVLSKMAIDQLNATTIGAKMPRVSWEDMASLAITIPPIHEQKQIALFVKSEKNRIGAMIEKLKMSIELLLEKRQSIITEAVTGKIDLR